ncbi:MAG: alpha-glucan family phosphorylase [Planctomycetes bacterium]|nr:alpha-glucan family phosphorylase [Planctomycetota bacterium]
MTPTLIRTKLEAIARNFWWTWHPEVMELFRDLDPALWREVKHRPLAFLARMDDATLDDRARALALETRILRAARRMDDEIRSHNTWGDRHAGVLKVRPVAYFSAEFGVHESMPIYSGGLGILAGDHVKASADLGVPLVGVGLLYRQGYFSQRLDATGWQQEEFEQLDTNLLPLEPALGPDGRQLTVEVNPGSSLVSAALWIARVGRNRIVLLDTDIPSNPAEYREITQRLYWGDQQSRIRQELVLGVGGMKALRVMGIRPGVLHLNEGHSAFALLEAIRQDMQEDGIDFESAAERVAERSVFTTHTPVPAGHDRFPEAMLLEHLAPMCSALGISNSKLMGLGRVDPTSDSETFCMTVLALKLCNRCNGVSAVHGDVSRDMWKSLWPGRKNSEVPIGHITNGVHVRSWIAREMLQIAERRLPADFAMTPSAAVFEESIRTISSGTLWEMHQVLKSHLISFVRQRYVEQEHRRGADPRLSASRVGHLLDPRALTLGFARRFATYKRATLFMRDPARLEKLLCNPERPVQLVFAGKSHPRDDGGKALIREIVELSRSKTYEGRIVFVEDYDIAAARMLVQGVDVWVNNPRRPEEACGTSGMKAALNGVLNCSIADGWWVEAWDGSNGFNIDSPGPHLDPLVQDARDHDALMDVLEQQVVPLFYDRAADGVPLGWIERMKQSLLTLGWRFSADRMVMNYTTDAYLPAARGLSSSTTR